MRLLTLVTALSFLSPRLVRAQSYFLFVGTYTNSGNLGGDPKLDSTGSKGIYVYRFDAATGKATVLSHTEGVCNPSYLVIAADGHHLYACTESRMLGKGSVSAFDLDRRTGKLRLIDKVPSGGDNPAYVTVSTSGKWVAVANYTGGSLSVFPTDANGALKPFVRNIQHTGHGVNPQRQEKPHVHSVLFGPDEKYLYVQDLGLDRISIEHFDASASEPIGTEAEQRPAMIVATPPGSGPRHLVFHPNGKFAYLIEEMGGCVDVYKYDPATGRLDSLQRIPAHPDTATGSFRSADLHVSPDGRFLYVSNRAENNIAIFSVNPATGHLQQLGYVPTLGNEPRNFTLDPSGKWLLIGNQESDSIILYQVDSSTGRLLPTGRKLSVPRPTCLKMVPAD